MTHLSLGVIGTSAKENEHRLPLHPEHLARLDPGIAARVTLEHGYGERFGHSDADLAQHVAGLATREEILAGVGRGAAAQAPARGPGRDA